MTQEKITANINATQPRAYATSCKSSSPTLQAKLVAGSVPFTATKHRQQGVHNTHYYHSVQIENRQVMRTHNHKVPLSTRLRQISKVLNHDLLMARPKHSCPIKELFITYYRKSYAMMVIAADTIKPFGRGIARDNTLLVAIQI